MSAGGLPTGVQKKHTRTCATRATPGARCRCTGGYQVQVGPRAGRKTQTFAELRDALAWRDAERARHAWKRTGRTPTVRHAGEEWLEAAQAGRALTRAAEPFRPSTLEGYERELRGAVYAAIGDKRLDDVTRGDLLALMGQMQRDGAAASTVRNVLVPLRSLYRFAMDHEWVRTNPTAGLVMPGVSGVRRERFASPDEVRDLLAALDERDRALWATAVYTGLRRGELRGLRWSDVELGERLVHVRQAWDSCAKRMGPPKTPQSARTVPIPEALVDNLQAHARRRTDDGDALVFCRGALAGDPPAKTARAPFSDVLERAYGRWAAAGLEPLGMHEARHTYASLMLAARVPMKVLSALMGHTSIQTTVDLYGHLATDARTQAAAMLDAHVAPQHDGAESNVVPLHVDGHSRRESA